MKNTCVEFEVLLYRTGEPFANRPRKNGPAFFAKRPYSRRNMEPVLKKREKEVHYMLIFFETPDPK
jgi:hypothetical protein